MVRFHSFVIAWVAVASLVLGSCTTTNHATGKTHFSLVSEEQEDEMGNQAARQEIKQYGLYKEKADLLKYYKKIGYRIKEVTETPEKEVDFIMLDSGVFNAWATPGYVNFYRGILPFFNSEAELVAVMSHEMGHTVARHSVRGVTKGRLANIFLALGATAIAVATDSNDMGNMAYGIGAVAATFAMKGFSREYEREADTLALRYMEKAGYDPREAWHTFKAMKGYRTYMDKTYRYFNDGEEMPKSPFYHFMLSHPDPQSRMDFVEQEKGKPDGTVKLPKGIMPATTESDPQGQRRYYRMLNGVAFGVDVNKGVSGRDVLYSKKHKFVWRLPKGFLMQYTSGNWTGYNNVSKIKTTVRVKRMGKKHDDAEEALRILFPKLSKIEPVTVGEVEAYTGIQRMMEKKGFSKANHTYTQRIFAIPLKQKEDAKGSVFALVHFIVPPESFETADEIFFTSIQNFKSLTAKQAKKIEPLRVKIHTVQRGETVASLSERMAAGELREDWFRAINGLESKEKLKTGQYVKLIIDANKGLF